MLSTSFQQFLKHFQQFEQPYQMPPTFGSTKY